MTEWPWRRQCIRVSELRPKLFKRSGTDTKSRSIIKPWLQSNMGMDMIHLIVSIFVEIYLVLLVLQNESIGPRCDQLVEKMFCKGFITTGNMNIRHIASLSYIFKRMSI